MELTELYLEPEAEAQSIATLHRLFGELELSE
jgi:hypothetical protein